MTTIASTAPHILPSHVIGARCTTSAATNVTHTRRRLAPHLTAPNAMGHDTGTVHKSPAPLHACGPRNLHWLGVACEGVSGGRTPFPQARVRSTVPSHSLHMRRTSIESSGGLQPMAAARESL